MVAENGKSFPLYPGSLGITKVIAPIKFKRNIVKAIEDLQYVEPINVDPRTGADQIMVENKRQQFETLRNKFSEFLNALDASKIKKSDAQPIGPTEDDALNFVNTIYKEKGALIEQLLQRKQEISDRINNLKGLINLLEQLESLNVSSTLIGNTSYTHTFLGSVFPPQMKRLKWLVDEVSQNRHFILDREISEEETIVLISILREDYEVVLSKLNSLSFQDIAIPKDIDFSGLTIVDCTDEITVLEKEVVELGQKLISYRSELGPSIRAAEEVCKIELDRVNVELTMRRTETTCILWAWLPEDRTEEFKTSIHLATEGSAILDFREGKFDPEFTPSYYENKNFMKPMRGLVTSFGVPSQREVDPYPFTRILFPVLFAIMFADVGHGFILFLLGWRAYRKRQNMTEIPKGISGYYYGGAELLMLMGATSFFMGFAFNSFFGDETILWSVPILRTIFEPTTWSFFFGFEIDGDYAKENNIEDLHCEPGDSHCEIHRNYVNFLIFSFVVGALIILMGLLLNVYQLRNHRHSDSELHASITLTSIYVSAILGAVFLVLGIPILGYIFIALAPTFVVVTLAIEFRAHGVDGMMLGVDHVISLLSNTFSFGRLLAMNTIHFVLAFLPYLFLDKVVEGHVVNHDVSHWLEVPSTEFYLWVIGAIIGSLIVVPVETVFSTLQALRLNWVEFYGKFYKGQGIEFKPIKVNRYFTKETGS